MGSSPALLHPRPHTHEATYNPRLPLTSHVAPCMYWIYIHCLYHKYEITRSRGSLMFLLRIPSCYLRFTNIKSQRLNLPPLSDFYGSLVGQFVDNSSFRVAAIFFFFFCHFCSAASMAFLSMIWTLNKERSSAFIVPGRSLSYQYLLRDCSEFSQARYQSAVSGSWSASLNFVFPIISPALFSFPTRDRGLWRAEIALILALETV